MMTRGGKNEAKVVNPMFPRLHVNDTADKGGPKAPPRNKMALYEQLSIPSQRSNSGSLSMLPLPPNDNNNNTLFPLKSSSHGGGEERGMFMPFYNSHDKFHSYSIPGTKLNTMKRNQEIKSMKDTDYNSLDTAPAIPEVSSKSNPLQPLRFSNFKKFPSRELGFEDDLTVLTSVLSTKCSSVDILNGEDGLNSRLHNEHMEAQDDMIFRENILVESSRCVENASKVRSESCLRESPGVDNGSSNVLENGSKALEKKCGDMQVGATSRRKKARVASMVESLSPFDICPDDVVEIIGEKNFWELRRAIVNHQRVFSLQVFELHRLIKVQRLIAGSPHMLLEDTSHMAKQSLFLKDISQKPNISIKRANDDEVSKLPLPSAVDDTNEGLVLHRPKYAPYSGNLLSTPIAANTWPSPYSFSPNGNHWLVPIMSPSEGLVYKPYAGPCPPTTRFLAPVYGNCGGFSNTPYEHGIGILPGNPPIDQSYFLPYGMPVSTAMVSGSAVEQISSFNRVQLKGNRSSCSMSSQMSQAISCCVGKLPGLKENEIQGSTASSQSGRANKGDALPLFPTEPTIPALNHDAWTSVSRGRAIKVVPHNPRLATESAARIFLTIQEERKQR